MRDWMRTTGGTIGICALLAAACDAGPFGSDAPEDHRFLIDLRNLSIEPVTVRVAGEAEGFLVQGISVLTIQRTAEPGQELVFEALIDESVLIQIAACRYTPPSDATPRRRVSWNGADLECLNWE
jgi:hypothetical protein